MSSSKRRKVDPQDVPQSPMSARSALSAIAARRRLGESTDAAATAASSPSASPVNNRSSANGQQKKVGDTISSPNAYSILQSLSRHGNSSSNTLNTEQAKTQPALTRPRKGDRSSILVSSSDLSSTQLSSFRANAGNFAKLHGGAVKLKLDGERVLILGSYGIRVLKGEVTLAGATLKPSTRHWAHAPHTHAIPVLRSTAPSIVEIYPDPSAEELRDLGRLSPLFRRIWSESDKEAQTQSLTDSTFRILYSQDDVPKKSIVQDLKSPPQWNKKLSGIVSSTLQNPHLSILVCGPKSAGKSTFSKLLTNRLLAAGSKGVAVMDLDPGQPEYVCPGTLSLLHLTEPNLSPSFVSVSNRSRTVLRCHALADTSPASDPDFYQECLTDLFNVYRDRLPSTPLIINTPGWILGTGLTLLESIISRVKPSQVVYMSEDGPLETVEALQRCARDTFSTLPSQQAEFTARTAAHLRAMQTMSYFHHQRSWSSSTSRDDKDKLYWNPSPLTTVQPSQVRYQGAQSGIVGIMSYNYQSSPELLAEAINGMVLAVVHVKDTKAFRGLQGTRAIIRTPEGLPLISNPEDCTLDPRFSETVGFVLVRGIDVANKCLQVITPLPKEQLQNIRRMGHQIVLVHGKFDVPSWAYTEDLYFRSNDGVEVNQDQQPQDLEIEDRDTSEDDSDIEPENITDACDVSKIPWVETLTGHQKRPIGSKVWRVRRDLGRNAGEG